MISEIFSYQFLKFLKIQTLFDILLFIILLSILSAWIHDLVCKFHWTPGKLGIDNFLNCNQKSRFKNHQNSIMLIINSNYNLVNYQSSYHSSNHSSAHLLVFFCNHQLVVAKDYLQDRQLCEQMKNHHHQSTDCSWNIN